MAPRRLTSCLCCDLPTGVLTIGIVYIILNSLGIIVLSVTLSSTYTMRQAVLEDPTLFKGPEPTEEEVQSLLHGVQVLFGVGLAVLIVCLPLDIVLIVGAQWRRPRLLLPWLGWYALITAGAIGWGLYLFIVMFVTADNSPEVWFFIGGQLGSAGVSVYLIAVVASYYSELRDQDERSRGYTMQPLTAA